MNWGETLQNKINVLLNFNYWIKHVRSVLDSPFPDISDQRWVSPLEPYAIDGAVIRWIYDLGYASGLSACSVKQMI